MKLFKSIVSISAVSIFSTGYAQVKEVVGKPGHSKAKGTILMIAANPAISQKTKWPIGAWAAELTHPFYEFKKDGYHVEFASGKIL